MKLTFATLLLGLAAPAAFAQQPATLSVPTTTAVQDKTQSSPRLNPTVEARAEHLSSTMVRDLHLNNYQATKLRAINADKTAKLDALERQYARNSAQLEQQSKAVSRERDQELQAVLTSDQYSDYFDARKRYAQVDRNYASSAPAAILVNSVQNPVPARDNNATIGPARPTTRPGRPAVRQ